jgi:hypothetical protein
LPRRAVLSLERFRVVPCSSRLKEVVVSWINNVLVVAGLTAGSDDLQQAMETEASRAPTTFVLVVPRQSSGQRGAIDDVLRLERALARAAEAGLHVRGTLGDRDPVIAAVQNFDPWRIDKIIVCTLPTGVSRWCGTDVPARIRQLTGAHVAHVRADGVRADKVAAA